MAIKLLFALNVFIGCLWLNKGGFKTLSYILPLLVTIAGCSCVTQLCTDNQPASTSVRETWNAYSIAHECVRIYADSWRCPGEDTPGFWIVHENQIARVPE